LRRRERKYRIARAITVTGPEQRAIANANSNSARTKFRQHPYLARGQWPVWAEQQ
jgi:hypothetical protein